MALPRGIRNNNPGNIEANSINWSGKVGDDGRFVKFDSMQNGVRALAILLINYYQKHGLVTVEQIISRYAPSIENNTDSYVSSVSTYIGVQSDDVLDLSVHLKAMVEAIIRHENGQDIAVYDIESGVRLAREYKNV